MPIIGIVSLLKKLATKKASEVIVAAREQKIRKLNYPPHLVFQRGVNRVAFVCANLLCQFALCSLQPLLKVVHHRHQRLRVKTTIDALLAPKRTSQTYVEHELGKKCSA
jgi:hypothetical protein